MDLSPCSGLCALAGHVEAGLLVAGARDPTELEEVWATLGAVEASGCGFGDRGDLTTLALTSSSSGPMGGNSMGALSRTRLSVPAGRFLS